jgi:hypothetical protein
MLRFRVINLLIPGDPQRLKIQTPSGTWELSQTPEYVQAKSAITGARSTRPSMQPVAETHFAEYPTGPASNAQVRGIAFEELTPLLLAATYATGMSVTILRSTLDSEVLIVESSDHWPRARAVDRPSFVVNSSVEFQRLVEAFVREWPTSGHFEKALLLIHHWLDALACWSMEDLYLSATTLLQIIVASEADKQRKVELKFFKGLEDAAKRMNLRLLGPDFKNMRNELVHDGRLIGSRFRGPDKQACAAVVADVLNWIDEYIHAAMNLGAVAKKRFGVQDFMALNAYSI